MFAAFTLALVWACVGVVPAFGAGTRVYQSSFGLFSEPEAVTVDGSGTASNGDVYVVDIAAGTVSRFTAAGVADDFSSVDADVSGNSITGFSFEANAAQVAVAPAGSPGGTAGDVYVVSDLTNNVAIFDSNGNHVGELNGSGDPNKKFGEACGVATDASTGAVYVGDFNGYVWRYTPTTGTVSEADYSGGIEPVMPICNVAADSENVYAGNTYSEGELRKYLASDFTTAATLPVPAFTLIDATATAVATDPSNGDVYVDEGNKISVFDSSGTALYTFGSEGDFGSFSAGVAVKGSGGDAYVADRSAGQIDVFGSPVNLIVAATNAATAIDHTDATLNGHLDPGADPAITDCHFDWGADTSYAGGTVPCAEGNTFNAPADVHADLTGLHPGTTYHFRLHITGSVTGEVTGEDQTLTTTTFPVSTDPATNLHHTDATLNGHFDPQAVPSLDVTACSFDWGTDTNYTGGSVPCAEGQSFSAPASVSALLNDLTPGVTYHFRLHLDTAGAGENFGQDRTVTPPPFPTISPQIAAFGPDGTSATSFSANNPFTLAFDQVNSELFAADDGPPGIYGFDAMAAPAFTPLVGFAPLATVPQGINELAVDNTVLSSGGNVYLASGATGLVYGFDGSGVSLGGNFPIDTANSPGSPDGSPKQVCGDAVDSTGDLWVSDAATGRLLRYTSTGSFLSSVDVSAQFPPPVPFGLCSMAFDSNDDLYVAAYRGEIWRFTHSSGYTAATRVENASADNRGIAVDPTTHGLLVVHNADVDLYDANGVLQATIATGIPGAGFGGLAVDATTHDVYVPDRGSQKIRVFRPETQRPPTITPGDPTAVTGASATLNAKVDPETFPVTDCHFESLTDAAFQANPSGDRFAGASQVPCNPDPGSGSGDIPVYADLTGLNAGSTYHFRFVAANAQPGGTATGPDQSFTTPGPAITDTRDTDVSDSAATLRASVNPRGHSTTYQFEYGTDTGYGHTAPAAPAAIGSGINPVSVAEGIIGLDPATTYHFRLIAQSSDGTDHGPDATFTTFGVPATSDTNCPNQVFRTGPGASLPDCRAYEQASPADKRGNSIVGQVDFNQAAADGHAAVFGSYQPLPTSGGSAHAPAYVASRGSSAWSYDGALPAGQASELGRDDQLRVSLSAVATNSGDSLFSTDLGDFSRLPLFSVPRAGDLLPDPQFAADTGHFIFEASGAGLTPDAVDLGPNNTNLYQYDHGNVSLAGRVPVFPATSCDDSPSGPGPACVAPAGGSFAGSYTPGDLTRGGGYKQDTISDDGTKVFFTEGATGRLYERLNGTSTIQLNADLGGNDPAGHKPASFLAATPSGSQVFFMSCEKLTPDSTAVSTAANSCSDGAGSDAGSDLYSYDTSSGQLTDLTVDSNAGDPLGAAVQGLLGVSPDGAYLYFTANGDLDGAGPAAAGDCDTPGISFTGSCSLYLRHDGATTFVARLGADPGAVVRDDLNWAPVPRVTPANERTARVVADGTLIFGSTRSLTGYSNDGLCGVQGVELGHQPPVPGPCVEFFRFDPAANSGDGRLDCVSCSPSGAPAVGNAYLNTNQKRGVGGLLLPGVAQGVLTRNLSSDGNRVFFETADKLLPADTNGEAGCPNQLTFPQYRRCQDVYEWEAEGSGSCHSAAQNGGCLYLLSSGTSDQPSFLDDASASGDDIFIYTDSRLVPQDSDQLSDLYDVRVDGGMSSQHRVVSSSCAGDVCQGAPSVPSMLGVPGSETLTGLGNLTPIGSGARKSEPKLLTRAQQLAKALKACRSKRDKHKRATCERVARKRYSPAKSNARKAGHSIATRKGGK